MCNVWIVIFLYYYIFYYIPWWLNCITSGVDQIISTLDMVIVAKEMSFLLSLFMKIRPKFSFGFLYYGEHPFFRCATMRYHKNSLSNVWQIFGINPSGSPTQRSFYIVHFQNYFLPDSLRYFVLNHRLMYSCIHPELMLKYLRGLPQPLEYEQNRPRFSQHNWMVYHFS